jgi:hypothetical protein
MKAKLIFTDESKCYQQLMLLGAVSYKIKGNEVTALDDNGETISKKNSWRFKTLLR